MKHLGIMILAITLLLGSCKVEQKIVDGQTAFDRKQYAVAIKLLTQEYNKSKTTSVRGEKAYFIGESYRIINDNEQAKEWYLKAYDSAYGAKALKGYAFALKQTEDYKEAIAQFKELGAEIGDRNKYQREIIACRQSSGWKSIVKDSEYKIELLDFNSNAADYYPMVYKKDQLVITSDRISSTGEDTYNWTGNRFSDLFLVDLKTGNITNFSSVLNSPFNEGTVSFSHDFTEALFSRCGDGSKADQYCKLMYSKLDGDEWTEPEVISFIGDKINYAHPSLSADGKTLYFSTDDPDGLGGFDIYKSTKTAEGWGDPVNLGSAINTEGNEVSPFIDQDTFYFSSDFHVGMGGFDVFKTEKLDGNGWGALQNMRAPINSGADDFGFVVDYRKIENDPSIMQSGYFTSTRTAGKGNDDIYKFIKKRPTPPKVEEIDTLTTVDTLLVNKPEEPKIDYQLVLEGKIVEKVFSTPDDPNSRVTGKTAVPNASVQVNYGDTTFNIKTNEKGEFSLRLKEQTSYLFTGSKTDYLTKDGRFSTRGIENDPKNPVQTFALEIELDKVYKGVDIVLEGIYYDLDKADIRSDARPVLNKLVNLLLGNPSISIELAAHTDCQGSSPYNQALSQKRAQAVVDYLVSKGVSASRLVAKGYGETQLLTDCVCSRCSEAEHQLNRRTAFKILD